MTNNERTIIEKHADEIFIDALKETFNWFLTTETFNSIFYDEIAIECKPAPDIVMKDVCDGEQYFYRCLEKKLRGVKITDLKIEKSVDK